MKDKAYRVNREWYASLRSGMQMSEGFAFPHRIKAFARLQCFPEMLLFSEIKDAPEWAIEDALAHFCHRYPTFVIGLYHAGRLWCGTRRKDVELGDCAKKFPASQDAAEWLRGVVGGQLRERFETDNILASKAYDVFYASQFISSRKNLKAQKRLMPGFFIERGTPEWKSMRENRLTKPNTTLKDFE